VALEMALSLHSCARRGDLEGVRKLVEDYQEDPNVQDVHSMTPLHYAAKRGHLSCVEYLVNHGAKLETKNTVGQTALHIASQASPAEFIEVARVLLLAGADPNTSSDHGMRPIHRVSKSGNIDLLSMLVKFGADVHAVDTFMGEAAIHHAATNGHDEVIRMLLSYSSRWMDDCNSRGETALHQASAGGHLESAKMLLLMGNTPEWKHQFINRKDARQEDTALHKACEYGHTQVARMLVDKGALVHCINILARTPLHYAAAKSDPNLVTFLLRAGSNHMATDCDGRRAIQHATDPSVRAAFETATAAPRERQEHISLTRLNIVNDRRKAWRQAEAIRESGTDEGTLLKLRMEKENREKRIHLRRITTEQNDLVYRLRADGAQRAIARGWQQFKARKEEQRKEVERQRRKQKADMERRKAEAAAAERALMEKRSKEKKRMEQHQLEESAPPDLATMHTQGGMQV